jgi:hypothetical protein
VPLAGERLVPRGAVWRITTDAAGPGMAGPPRAAPFAQPDFDDAGWSEAVAPLGFGFEDLASEIEPPAAPGQMAVFVRRAFEVPDPARFSGLVLELRRDDGARIFLNGREIARSNLPGGRRIGATTRAGRAVGGEAEERTVRLGLPPELLARGRNVLAASVHNREVGSRESPRPATAASTPRS